MSAHRTRFSRVWSKSAGLDPYTTASSDVYQDLFGRGSYIGKGIYDVDAFEAAVGNAFPENQVLSHDLIEGNYARCGLVSDIELVDDFPGRYHAYARREHRWARGDWQLLPRLSAVFASNDRTFAKRKTTLPLVERWKVLDNLRRCLVPLALVLLLVLGWTLGPGSAWFWTLAALAVPAFPLIQVLLRAGRQSARRELAITAAQVALEIIFLAEQSYRLADAIARTLYRLYVSGRNLLEWETAASAEQRLGDHQAAYWRSMWPAPALAASLCAIVLLAQPRGLLIAAPLLIAWTASPAVAWWMSQPPRRREASLSEQQRQYLRRTARKTWFFFETFVGPQDHWLPPDNFQEDPKGQIAHRTSPTNIGLYLLSTLAAHDFGYLGLCDCLERLEHTFNTFDQLPKYQGHLFNWYDTQTLAVLDPPYVSTVDSGNLLASLWTLAEGLGEKLGRPLDVGAWAAGLGDTLHLAEEAFRTLSPRHHMPDDLFERFAAAFASARAVLAEVPSDVSAAGAWLSGFLEQLEALNRHEQSLDAAVRETPEALARWLDHLQTQARSLASDCAPWGSPPVQGNEQRGLFNNGDTFGGGHTPTGSASEADSHAAWKARIETLIERIERFGERMRFTFLYNEPRHLFSIGYNHAQGRLDNAHYDLLASEARLTSFLAIARGEVPRKHWFQLGRHLSRAGGGTLLSWGGTMFEYLMPRLFFRRYPDTLLDMSCRGAVARQIEYGRQSRVPWGVSESGFNALDGNLDYQYQSFGVPGLGLKRGLSHDLVVAPYATALALAIDAPAAIQNLHVLAAARAEGPYGFYEAVDYTRDRLMERHRSAIVRSYMAHHQGMSLLALSNCLDHGRMTRRFHARPEVRATELLLQERAPDGVPYVEAHGDEATPPAVVRDFVLPLTRRIMSPDTPHPLTLLLSNGSYRVLVTNAGSGYSAWRDLDVTRWREDRTCDAWGQFCYVRDLRTGALWSSGHQPLCRPADHYEVRLNIDKAEFYRRDGNIETHQEITVSPENDAEIRRLTLTNHDSRSHDLELTSYAEIVLSPHRADRAHPAFGKLFLETEYLAGTRALVCRRRPRAADQSPHWAVHVLAVDGPMLGEVQYETDRCRFLGRGRTPERPKAIEPGAVLSGATGPVLDPVFSLRCRVRLAPGASMCIAFTTAVAVSREEALSLADQYHDFHSVNRAFELAWAHSQVQLRHLHLTSEEVHLFQRLASQVVYAGRTLRGSQKALLANCQGQSGLWRFGISGDKPIVLAHIGQSEQLALARQLLAAHDYWRLHGLEVDLVIVNDDPSGYLDELNEQLLALIRASDSHGLADKPGGVYLRKAAQLSDDDRNLLAAAARVVLSGSRGSLAAQVDRRTRAPQPVEHFAPRALAGQPAEESDPLEAAGGSLQFENGLGGFTPDGREYAIRIVPRAGEIDLPPAPWINVIANRQAGFLISETGGGYSWAGNSQMNRLTPWNNDPVSDSPGEIVYLRDEATGDVWTPTPLPLGRDTATIVRHGQGYTTFERQSHGIWHELTVFVPAEQPLKLVRLKLRNATRRQRRLAAVLYAEWVLGGSRDDAPMQVITELDAESGALLARNPFGGDFAARVAFADVNRRPHSVTADRTEFLGRNGSPSRPAALQQTHLSGKTGAGLDPCAALMVEVELPPEGEQEITFLLGQAETVDECRRLLAEYRQPAQVQAALDDVCHRWHELLTTIEVRTPDPALDLLVNRWLLYQVQSCRVWGRSAFYQSGGAYGFRDQLQDSMALVYANPSEAREHLLRAASRQFLEGDVQHWWHPPTGRGVRTRFSDDLLWLPFVAAHYVSTTGDAAVLDEQVSFLRAAPLRPEQEEDYGLPEVVPGASLYEHCARAIEHGSRRGQHGLPLMGTGDWNDGMNRVGAGGKGESVWDAWFLLAILPTWIDVATRRGDEERAAKWRDLAAELRESTDTYAWDGGWYRRAYFDDGTPLGSQDNTECRIDAIAQAWSVISGAAPDERARQAMDAVDRLLVKPDKRLIMLLTPPFDQGPLEPGYIKGYLPGIRENGGQYTHAATWVVDAMARLGRGTRAVELYDLLNPIHHARTREDVERYRVEPYVVAADIYSQPPHVGRGGWTWYTGSAAWMYRVALESILGFRLQGDQLRIEPCIAADWREYTITYRRGSATYIIRVENPAGVERGASTVTIDGRPAADGIIPVADDGREHQVVVRLG
ncbi:MAG TPA: glucoamylase family protein [Pirellulales bacterium]|nr:glucoamylase family protein [Pirellulales bacterium]